MTEIPCVYCGFTSNSCLKWLVVNITTSTCRNVILIYPTRASHHQALEMVAVIQCGGGYKDQVQPLEQNVTPCRPTSEYRPAVILMVKKTSSRWRRIPLNILVITQASKISSPFKEQVASLLCSHEPITGPLTKLSEPSPRLQILSHKDLF
jgi:hypothetical protein